MSKLDSNVKKQLHNAKYVTRLAKQRMMNTIIKHGQMAQRDETTSFYYGPPLDPEGF